MQRKVSLPIALPQGVVQVTIALVSIALAVDYGMRFHGNDFVGSVIVELPID